MSMTINNTINSNVSYASSTKNETRTGTTRTETKPQDNVIAQNSDNDTVEKGNTGGPKTSYIRDKSTVNQIKSETENKYNQMMNLITKMMTAQGKQATVGMGLGDMIGMLDVDQKTVEQAQKDISEDGYWGVNKTSERIIDFAKAITGGDPSQIEKMRKAIKAGFGAAQDEWGKSKMPQITQDTYDAVMKGLDEWAAAAAKKE